MCASLGLCVVVRLPLLPANNGCGAVARPRAAVPLRAGGRGHQRPGAVTSDLLVQWEVAGPLDLERGRGEECARAVPR